MSFFMSLMILPTSRKVKRLLTKIRCVSIMKSCLNTLNSMELSHSPSAEGVGPMLGIGLLMSPIMGSFRDREMAQMRLNRLTQRNRVAATAHNYERANNLMETRNPHSNIAYVIVQVGRYGS